MVETRLNCKDSQPATTMTDPSNIKRRHCMRSNFAPVPHWEVSPQRRSVLNATSASTAGRGLEALIKLAASAVFPTGQDLQRSTPLPCPPHGMMPTHHPGARLQIPSRPGGADLITAYNSLQKQRKTQTRYEYASKWSICHGDSMSRRGAHFWTGPAAQDHRKFFGVCRFLFFV